MHNETKARKTRTTSHKRVTDTQHVPPKHRRMGEENHTIDQDTTGQTTEDVLTPREPKPRTSISLGQTNTAGSRGTRFQAATPASAPTHAETTASPQCPKNTEQDGISKGTTDRTGRNHRTWPKSLEPNTQDRDMGPTRDTRDHARATDRRRQIRERGRGIRPERTERRNYITGST